MVAHLERGEGGADLLRWRRTRALRDRTLDVCLRHDGFVVVPGVITADMAATLAGQHRRMRGRSGQGFEADLSNPDTAHRRSTSDILGAALDDVVSSLFTDHELFLRVFLCKWPGADSELYLHRDWMYVDEREGHRTYVVWIALTDVTGHQGQLRVLRGSHRIDQALRGTNLNAAWIQHEGVIRPRLEDVPLAAGDAVVLDNGLVHCSYPNHTERARVAAGIGVRPRTAPLVYFRGDGPVASRFDVDDEFFLQITPAGLEAGPPSGIEASETVDSGRTEFSGDELGRRLDLLAAERRRSVSLRWAHRKAR